jgi:BirA family transcriptional regulator, biotin operon repressor / biotin---[acetyl-CoA-carboxylase] ligase
MKLPNSERAAARLTVLAEATSTNDVLVASAATEPEFTVVVTGSQTGGRGRLGRGWVAPPGRSLAISVLLRPAYPGGERLPIDHFGWLPLIAGAAMAQALAPLVRGRVGLKWPNDVQIDGLKVSGLLAELAPAGDAVVLGAGVNVALTADELPTAVSTSLLLAGAHAEGDELADAVLSGYLQNLRALYGDFLRYGADVEASGTLDLLTELCTTLGQQVRVELPGGTDLHGTATAIDRSGRLEVRRGSDGAVVAVAAGDVTHVRHQ